MFRLRRAVLVSLLVLIVLAALPAQPASYAQNQQAQRLTVTDVLGGRVSSVVPLSDGGVLAASGDRLLRLEPPEVTAEIVPNRGTIVEMVAHGGSIYALTETGVLVLSGVDGRPQGFVAGGGQAVAAGGQYIVVAAREAGLRRFLIGAAGGLVPQAPVPLPEALDVALTPSTAYVAGGAGGVLAVDLQSGTVDEILPDLAPAEHVALSGVLLSVSSGGTVFTIDPAARRVIGTYAPLRDARRILMRDEFAYIADATDGLKIMWLAAPDRPVQAYGEHGSPAYDVAVSGDLAVVGGVEALRLVDIRSSYRPLFLGEADLPAAALGVALGTDEEQDRAYVALGEEGVGIVDITNLAAPRLVRRVPLEGPAQAVLAVEPWLFIAMGEAGLGIVSLEEPGPPLALPLGCAAEDLARRGQFLFIACGEAGLVAVDVLRPAQPAIVGGLAPQSGDAYRTITIQGKRAYIAGDLGLTVVDINRASQMGRLAFLPMAVSDVGVNDIYLYAAAANGISVYDARATAEPIFMRFYTGITQIAGMAGDETRLWLTNDGPGTDLAEISLLTPDFPVEVGSSGSAGHTVHVTTDGASLWLAQGFRGAQRYERTDGAPIPREAYTTLPPLETLTGDGGFIAGAGLEGWGAAEVLSPGGLRPLGAPVFPADVRGAAFAGDDAEPVAVVAAGVAGVLLYDLEAGELLARQPTVGAASGVVVSGDWAFVSDTGGLLILDARTLTPITRVSTPQPATDIDLVGERALLTLADGSFALIDVSAPTGGVLPLSRIETRRPAQLLPGPTEGDTSVYTLSENGLLRLNVDDPAAIETFERGQLPVVATRGFFVPGAEVLLGAYGFDDRVRLYQLGDALEDGLMQVGAFSPEGEAVVLVGAFAFLAGEETGLRLVDIRTEALRILLDEQVTHLTLNGDVLLALGERLTVWDVRTPGDPRLIGAAALSGNHIAAGPGGTLLVSTADGVRIIRLINGEPQEVGRLFTEEAVTRAAAAGQTGFAALVGGGVLAFTLSDPAGPVPAFAFASELGQFATDMLPLDDRHLLISWEGGIEAVQIGDFRQAPRLEEVIAPQGWAQGGRLTLTGEQGALALGTGQVILLDVAGGLPRSTGAVSTPGDTIGAVLHGETLFIADGACGLRAFEPGVERYEEVARWPGSFVTDVVAVPSGEVIVADAGLLTALAYDPTAPPQMPATAQQPQPFDGASGQPGDVTLRWGPPPDRCDSVAYSVYLGVEPDPPLVGRVNTPQLLIGGLEPGVTYNWRIDTTDRRGETVRGPLWQFTVAAADFEGGPPAPPTFLERLRETPAVPTIMVTLLALATLGVLLLLRRRGGAR